LDLATGELTVLTDDGVPIVGGEGGDIDIAPTFTPDGTLYFFRLSDPSDGVQAVLHRYDGDGVATAIGPALAGVPPTAGRSVSDDSIVTMLSALVGSSELVSVDVDGGTSRSIVIEGPSPAVADVAGDRALLVAPSRVASGGFELWVADIPSGNAAPIDIPQLAASSMRVTGGGLSPDGDQVALILADQDDPDGHLLLVADIAADGSVGPLTVLATGPEFAPNDGDLTIKPAGLGRLGEIVWTDAALVYSLGPDEIITLPLP
jgi:Tol biopolymer transport system component